MKAQVITAFGEPHVFELQDIERPQIQPNEVLIRTLGGSVNPIDWKQRRGKHKWIMGSKFPIVLGYDVSGEVVETGAAVSRCRVGDRVCGVLDNKYGGGLGEWAKGEEKCFALLPKTADVARYGVLPLAALTALQSLRDRARLHTGQKILILGASGGVGHYAVQIAHILGATIYAVSSGRHQSFLENLAPLHHIDYTRQNVYQLQERFDVIYDTIGSYPFPKCKHLLAAGGIHINTLPRPKILYYKLLSCFTRSKRVKTHLMQHIPSDLEQLVQWVETGKLQLCVDKEFPVTQIDAAHHYMEQGHTRGKILIRYTW